MNGQLVEFRRYRVSVEVATPSEHWLTRLADAGGCAFCHKPLPDIPIYLNTEGPQGAAAFSDQLCSWICLLQLAAEVVVADDDDSAPLVSVEEIPDWRANLRPPEVPT